MCTCVRMSVHTAHAIYIGRQAVTIAPMLLRRHWSRSLPLLLLVLIRYAGTKQAITTARRDERSAQNESGGENAFYAFDAVYLSHSHLLSVSS